MLSSRKRKKGSSKILDTLQRCKEILKEVSEFPESEARFLIEEVTGKHPLLNWEEIGDEDTEKIERLLNLRVRERIPLQYLIGKAYFFDLEFKMREGVFIPRPETEIMIEFLMEKKAREKSFKFLDIGTGCGNIAITVLKHFPNSRGIATDISVGAVKLAKENAHLHGVSDRLSFIVTDGLLGLKGIEFDIIFSNPPYVPSKLINELSPEVRREPRIALDGGERGLSVIEKFIHQGYPLLRNGGMFFLEVGPETYKDSLKLAKKYFIRVEIKRDLDGRPRVLLMEK
jgi:release factor glutamine methyltransferase